MLSSSASMGELAGLARNLGVSLYSGISVVKAFELAARKTTGSLRSALQDVIVELKSGSDVTSALENHSRVFPQLFIDMVRVGEVTGNLPEVLKSLAGHYESSIRLRRDFISQITMPVIQLVAAILIIAALIFILGWIGESTGQPFDVLGWGLMGGKGAMIWLGGWVMGVAALFILYRFLGASLSGKRAVHQFLLGIPVIGPCLRSFAIARFSWAFALTQGGGMPIEDSLDASLRATSNGVFIAATPGMIDDVTSGETLTDAFENSHLFPREYLEFVLVAEQSGTVPEALDRLGPQFEDDARRSLQALTVAFGWLIWGAVALFIIYVIFSVASWYVGMIDQTMRELGV
ncbi:MAG TPA: type II secretion system F family protein [Planctomicrobium sp.]|nr:type II secretion system F family protein [Planctomicrobium sp.]